MAATKLQLRQEIAELRMAGSKMANICWNLAQKRSFNGHDLEVVDESRKEWDAIQRRETFAISDELIARAGRK